MQKLFDWYGKKIVVAATIIVVVLIVIAAITKLSGKEANQEIVASLPTVEVASVASLNQGSSLEVVGTVEAISKAAVQTEATGRVTSVPVSIGDRVNSGAVLATLENASERAALTQAEGVYDAARAAAAQSNISVDEAATALTAAENNARNTVRTAFSTTQSTVYNSFDQFFANPEDATPGFKLISTGFTSYMNAERISLKTTLGSLSDNQQLTSEMIDAALSSNIAALNKLISITDTFIVIFNDDDTAGYTSSELATFSSEFTTLKNTLNAQLAALESSATGLETARATYNRVQLGGTNTENSAANAQVKQALGALQSAQAAYSKTIITTPIGGEVNSVSVEVGDYVSSFSPVATVANNEALKITTYVSESERDRIQVGSTVIIEDLYEGTISNVAPAVDSATKKVEVIIQTTTSELANGESVTVLIPVTNSISRVESLSVPISALKVETDRIVVFTVSSDNLLVAHAVTEGPLLGESMIIGSGIDSQMVIVVDARGKNEGDEVSIRN